MKALRIFLITAIAVVLGAQSTIVGAVALNQFGGPILLPQTSFSCAVQASIKSIGSGKNEVTYKIGYTSNEAMVSTKYNITATTYSGNKSDVLVNKNGTTAIVKGFGSFAPDNKPTQGITFAIAGVDTITLGATVAGKKCTSKTLKPVLFISISGPILQPVILFPPLTVDFTKLPACQVYAEGSVQEDGGLTIASAINFQNYKKAGYDYEVSGYTDGQVIPTASFKGRAAADGNGLMLNETGSGFIFKVAPKNAVQTFVIKTKLGNVTCRSVSFTAPAKPGEAATATPEGGTTVSSDTPEEADKDSGEAPAVTPEPTTPTPTPTPTVINNTTTTDDDSWKDYVMYGLLIAAVIAATGYGAYRLGRNNN